MALNIFKRYHFNKDGSINYDRSSKSLGMSKSDLIFMHKGRPDVVDTPQLISGVFVGYHPTSTSPMFFAPWIMQTCYHSNKDMSHLRDIIYHRHAPDWSTYDYFIMDSSGKVLYKNFDITTKQDENGVIHLSSPDGSLCHAVYPAQHKQYPYKRFFCYGRDIADLNRHINMAADKKIIKKPKHYHHGFTKTPLHPVGYQNSIEKQ